MIVKTRGAPASTPTSYTYVNMSKYGKYIAYTGIHITVATIKFDVTFYIVNEVINFHSNVII